MRSTKNTKRIDADILKLIITASLDRGVISLTEMPNWESLTIPSLRSWCSLLWRVCSGIIAIKGLEDVGAIAAGAEEASGEVSKIPEAATRTTGEAETSIKEVEIISMVVVEEASTRWEITQGDSRIKTASHRTQEMGPTTKLSCADILSFVSTTINTQSFFRWKLQIWKQVLICTWRGWTQIIQECCW